MSDDLVKTLLESLTDEQKAQLVQGLLKSNQNNEVPTLKIEIEETVSSTPPRRRVNEDFTVKRDENLDNRKTPVRARKNDWVDDGEARDANFDYAKFEKMKTPRQRGKPKKRDVECHVCGRTFTMNEGLIYGEYVRCNRCTGR
jgi:DNA-directed RNA polymerase subunit RPC12/RpoP